MVFLAIALNMNKALSMPAKAPSSPQDLAYSRARTCAAWTAHHMDVACGIGLMRVSQPIDPSLSKLPILPQTQVSVSSMLSEESSYDHTVDTLFRERCGLTRLISKLNDLLFGHLALQEPKQVMAGLQNLNSEFTRWNAMLPPTICSPPELSEPMYEIQ
ncbi:hypothetical protein LTR78_005925 [Recurvomyces mirabilis]|uniref:Uncharacterized protein n=1 Tax=Recurvomyces mirabilis TaxID=574656 RepID=A0AAE1C0K2_9PEZI|nr:hypothetical protein LTR78_005925 [Recurvomyces mirabilis]